MRLLLVEEDIKASVIDKWLVKDVYNEKLHENALRQLYNLNILLMEQESHGSQIDSWIYRLNPHFQRNLKANWNFGDGRPPNLKHIPYTRAYFDLIEICTESD